MADRVVETTETETQTTEATPQRETVIVHDNEPRQGLSTGAIVAIVIIVLLLLFLIFGRGLFGGGSNTTTPTVTTPTTTGQ